MSDVKLYKAHTLGLDKARELAKQWAEDSAKKMGLDCKHTEGADKDTITFERMGVTGLMTVTGTSFENPAHLKVHCIHSYANKVNISDLVLRVSD